MEKIRIVVAPDSFKGCLTAAKVASAIEKGIRRASDRVEIYKTPMADGGEGTVEAMVTAAGGKIRNVRVTGPLGEKVSAFYGILNDNKTAVIEMAAASGLPLVPVDKRNPLLTTSYGTGELIRKALEDGCSGLIIGIGGSATNDGGMGMLQALGVKFIDSCGNELGYGGKELEKIHTIDIGQLPDIIKDATFTVACDVANPLCGPDGASSVFGPQKGVNKEMVERLDKGLENFAKKIIQYMGKDIVNLPGAGAAGGMGGGLSAFMDAVIKPGIQIMTEVTGLEEKIKKSDLVITGEGNTDFQTAFGKVPVGVSRIAKKYNKPVICLSGGLGKDIDKLYLEGITGLFSIINRPMSLEDAMIKAEDLLESSAVNLVRIFLGGLA